MVICHIHGLRVVIGNIHGLRVVTGNIHGPRVVVHDIHPLRVVVRNIHRRQVVVRNIHRRGMVVRNVHALQVVICRVHTHRLSLVIGKAHHQDSTPIRREDRTSRWAGIRVQLTATDLTGTHGEGLLLPTTWLGTEWSERTRRGV